MGAGDVTITIIVIIILALIIWSKMQGNTIGETITDIKEAFK